MKIFLVISKLGAGGAERVMSELANEFVEIGHNVNLVLLVKSDFFYKLDTRIKIHRLNFINYGGVNKIISEFRVLLKLRKLLVKHQPDHVLSFMDKFNVLTILASRFLNLNVFVSDRSNPNKSAPKILNLIKKITYKYATGIVAQTSLARNVLYEKTGNQNIKVIPNPIRKVEIYPLIKREKIIINIGRMVPEKGHKYLLEIFSLLDFQDWKLVILGEGPLREELEKYAIELGIENNIHLPGRVRNIDEWLVKSSIFAFTSISEGFPNALVEAMAAGLPCISFDCDAGPRDIIENGVNGLLVPVGDIESFVEKINMIINNETLKSTISKEAKKIATKYERNKIAKEYLEFFNSK